MSASIQMLPSVSATAATRIDETARVSENAEIGAGCTVMPYAVIGDRVRLGPGCTVYPHAVLEGPAQIGPKNEFHPFACIGGPPQDLRHRGEPTELVIGEGNVFREMVTVNRGTVHGGGKTVIGDANLFMAYTHIAHDCRVGNRVVFANHATLAGHTAVEDYAVFGGMVAVGTFLRVGESAMLAAGAMIERDVVPFCIVAGDRARLRAVNRVGLARRGFDDRARRQIKMIFRALKDPSQTVSEIIASFQTFKDDFPSPEAERMLAFVTKAKRGLVR